MPSVPPSSARSKGAASSGGAGSSGPSEKHKSAAAAPPGKDKPAPPGKDKDKPAQPEKNKRLVEAHIPFVRSIARKLREQVPMVEFDDLVGFGMQGLLEAAQRFDERHGVAFTTFAYYRVRGAMFDGLRAMGWLPRAEYARLRMEERATSYLHNMAARDEGYQEQAAKTGAATGTTTVTGAGEEPKKTEAVVREVSDALHGVAAVFVTLLTRNDERTLLDERSAPHEELERHQLAQRVRRALQKLPDKERRLIEAYYFQDQTLEQVGAGMGLSKSWTSRLHARAIALLREALDKEEL
jgi:RNA polymerase sigma factor for flagellar operon FliA